MKSEEQRVKGECRKASLPFTLYSLLFTLSFPCHPPPHDVQVRDAPNVSFAIVPRATWSKTFIVVSGKQLSPTTTGKHFIKAFVSDRSAQVTARMWNATREIFNAMPKAGLSALRGRIENYQNNLQCIIETDLAGKGRDLRHRRPAAADDARTSARCAARLSEMLGSIQNRHLSALVQAYLDDEKLMADFCQAPAAMSFPPRVHRRAAGAHAQCDRSGRCGLPVLSRAEPRPGGGRHLPARHRQDVGTELRLRLRLHRRRATGGAHRQVGDLGRAEAPSAEAMLGEKIPQPLIDVMQHIILSHHDKPEFGSPKTPATPEAIAVHMIENLDAKLMMVAGGDARRIAERRRRELDGIHEGFGGRLYRPMPVAPRPSYENRDRARSPMGGRRRLAKRRNGSAENHQSAVRTGRLPAKIVLPPLTLGPPLLNNYAIVSVSAAMLCYNKAAVVRGWPRIVRCWSKTRSNGAEGTACSARVGLWSVFPHC